MHFFMLIDLHIISALRLMKFTGPNIILFKHSNRPANHQNYWQLPKVIKKRLCSNFAYKYKHPRPARVIHEKKIYFEITKT